MIKTCTKNFLFISHEVNRTGAPLVLLRLIEWISQNEKDIKVTVLALKGGSLSKNFQTVAHEYLEISSKQHNSSYLKILPILNSFYSRKSPEKTFIEKLAIQKFDLIYANSLASLPIATKLKDRGNKAKIIAHIHELELVIKTILPSLQNYLKRMDGIIAVSEKVKLNLMNNYGVTDDKIQRIYEFTKSKTNLLNPRKDFMVGGCGTVEWRKGSDLFIQLAIRAKEKFPEYNIKFCWVGYIPEMEKEKINFELNKLQISRDEMFIGELENVEDIFQEMDVLALTSREDPFPLIGIEAGMMGKPIVCFQGATGTEEVLKFGGGEIVSYLNVEEMLTKIIEYFEDKDKLYKDGEKGKTLFSNFTPENQAPKILNYVKKILQN